MDTTDTTQVVEASDSVFAHKIRLLDIRHKLMAKHEELGLIRNKPDEYYDKLSIPELKRLLEALGESIADMQETELSMHLKKINRQRYLKVWHDHSSIGGHGHLLVTVSCIYDPAFYNTPEEVDGVDVQSIVEKPELHILGRSTSSPDDQALFNQCRLDCIKELAEPIYTSNGVAVKDILRFFHGDGPAQQYEAGNSVGGVYPCVGCGIQSTCIQNLEHAFKCPTRTLKERRDFIVKGNVWREGGINLYERMKVGQLRNELRRRGISTEGTKKPELVEMFRSIRQGITNIPPLLQENPMADIEQIQLGQYEVSPCEPLHDLKSHFSNIIDESENLLTGNALDAFKQIKAAVLNKITLRCSDYRRAMVLMYLKLKDFKAEQMVTEVFRTGLEISHLLYTHEYNRTHKAVLALHNTTFIHGMLCTQLFSNPVTITSSKMFGRFFHSLTTHSPTLFRIISMRSINTENQERMFGQAKAITKATSCNRPNEIITNIILRVQMEAAQDGDRESDINKLSKAVGPRPNSSFSNTLMAKYPEQYQAHLERISDFLLPGKYVWWKYVAHGVEFLDGEEEKVNTEKEPKLMHFRGQTLPDVELYLQQKWEECICLGITVPAKSVKYYKPPKQTTSPEASTMIVVDNSTSDLQTSDQCNTHATIPADSHEVSCQKLNSTLPCTSPEASTMIVVDNSNSDLQTSDQCNTHATIPADSHEVSCQNPTSPQNASHSYIALTCMTMNDGFPLSCVLVKSKLCQAIGETEDVIQLDKLRITLKTEKTSKKQNTSNSIELYKYQLAKVRQHVMKVRRDFENLLSKHEQDFYALCGRIPQDEKDSPTWANLKKKTNYANKLLLAWNTNM